MKKKFLLLMMITNMALTVFACGKDSTGAQQTTEEISSVDTVDDVPTAQENTEESETESDEAEESVGTEFWCGYMEASNKDQSGQPDEYGTLRPIIYDGGLEGDTFTIVGTLNFKNFADQDPVGMVGGETNTFKVDENTKYLMVGGDAGPEEVTKEKFAEYFETLIDSGLYFQVELENGVAKVVQLCS